MFCNRVCVCACKTFIVISLFSFTNRNTACIRSHTPPPLTHSPTPHSNLMKSTTSSSPLLSHTFSCRKHAPTLALAYRNCADTVGGFSLECWIFGWLPYVYQPSSTMKIKVIVWPHFQLFCIRKMVYITYIVVCVFFVPWIGFSISPSNLWPQFTQRYQICIR